MMTTGVRRSEKLRGESSSYAVVSSPSSSLLSAGNVVSTPPPAASSSARSAMRSSDNILVDGLRGGVFVVDSLRFNAVKMHVFEPSVLLVGGEDWWLLLTGDVSVSSFAVFLNMSGHGWGVAL